MDDESTKAWANMVAILRGIASGARVMAPTVSSDWCTVKNVTDDGQLVVAFRRPGSMAPDAYATVDAIAVTKWLPSR